MSPRKFSAANFQFASRAIYFWIILGFVSAAMLLMLTMLPDPRSAIPGANPATNRNGARTLPAYIASKSSSDRDGAISQPGRGHGEHLPDRVVEFDEVALQISHGGLSQRD